MAAAPDNNHSNDRPVFIELHWTDRWLLPLLSIGVVLDLIISGVLIWLSLITNQAADRAQTAASTARITQAAQYQTCLATNEARRESLQLWEANHQLWGNILEFINEPQARPFRDAIQHNVDSQQALAQKTFALKDCTGLLHPTATTVPTSTP